MIYRQNITESLVILYIIQEDVYILNQVFFPCSRDVFYFPSYFYRQERTEQETMHFDNNLSSLIHRILIALTGIIQ